MGTAILLVEQNVSRALALVQRAYVRHQRRVGKQQAGASGLPRYLVTRKSPNVLLFADWRASTEEGTRKKLGTGGRCRALAGRATKDIAIPKRFRRDLAI
jgi:hypothetical protein